MPSAPKPATAHDRRATGTLASDERPSVVMISVVGWLVPGASHALQGQVRKATVFFAVLVAMFAIGIACGGRLFPFQIGDPLVFLAAAAEWALGLPRLVAGLAGYGQGEIVASAYEYGNTFLITAGLLNALVLLDAVDLATGRKSR
jgi:hypothetical protein